MGHEDAALRRLRGAAAPAEAGCSGSEVLAWALEGDRWLQDSKVLYMPQMGFLGVNPVPYFACKLVVHGNAEQGVASQTSCKLGHTKHGGTPLPRQTYEMPHLTQVEACVRPVVMRLAARYLLRERRRGAALDHVANFHLRNGAAVARLNWRADPSARGLAGSVGIMINYECGPPAPWNLLKPCHTNGMGLLGAAVLRARLQRGVLDIPKLKFLRQACAARVDSGLALHGVIMPYRSCAAVLRLTLCAGGYAVLYLPILQLSDQWTPCCLVSTQQTLGC